MPSNSDTTRQPWNIGCFIGPKPPFKPKHIWAIRTRLQHEGRTRDLALFNTAIDSKLRGCDLVRLRVADVYLVSTPSASSSDPPKQKSPLPWVRPHWGRARDALADDRGAWGPAAA